MNLDEHRTSLPWNGAQKRKTAVFCVKSHFAWKKSTTKILYVKTVNDKVRLPIRA